MPAFARNVSHPHRGGRTRSGAGNALRTCLSCRRSKTRCQLPDLTVASSATPLSDDKACRRCRSLSAPCVVDDSQRRVTKAGTSRYGLDGLLERSALANTTQSDGHDLSQARRARRAVYSPSVSQADDTASKSLSIDDSAGSIRVRSRSPSNASSQDQMLSYDLHTTASDNRTPPGSSICIPEPLRPGMLDLLYPDIGAALSATAAAASSASSASPCSAPEPSGSANETSADFPWPPPVAALGSTDPHGGASVLEVWNPFLYWIKLLRACEPPTTTNDFLAVTLQHLNLLLLSSPCHGPSRQPSCATLPNSAPHRKGAGPTIASSRKKLFNRVAQIFLGREPPSLRAMQALILLSVYDPPDLFLPHTSGEGSDPHDGGAGADFADARENRRDSPPLSGAVPALPPPGRALVDLACSMARQLGLPRMVASATNNVECRADSQEAPLDVVRFLTLIALFNLRAKYLPSRTADEVKGADDLSLLHGLSIQAVLARCDNLSLGAAVDGRVPACQTIAVRSLASQFKMSSAFVHAFRKLRAFPAPISTVDIRVEELHAQFRSVVQTSLYRFALDTKQERDSNAADQWLVILRTQATDMELALWSYCIYLELGPHGSPTPCADDQTVITTSSVEYDAVFPKLKARNFQGARFLATVTERCTDLAHGVLNISYDLLTAHDEAHSTSNFAPVILRCTAVFRAVKVLSQLWMLVLLKWSSLSARLIQALDVLDVAARTLRDAHQPCMLELALLVRHFLILTNKSLRELLQAKQDELACGDRKGLIDLAGGLDHVCETAETDRDPSALIARSTGNVSTARSDRSQSRSQIATQVDSQSGGIHPFVTRSSPRHVQSALCPFETQGHERLIGSMPSQTRHSLDQSHRPDHHQHQHAMQGPHQLHQQIERQSSYLHAERRQTAHPQLGGYGGQSSAMWSTAAGPIASLQPIAPQPDLDHEGILWDDLLSWDLLDIPH